MKTEQEKIEEIATEMCGISKNNNCGNCVVNSPCIYLQGAKKLYSAGYRKATEVIDEFVEMLKERMQEFVKRDYNEIMEGHGFVFCLKISDALIAAGIGDVSKWKDKATAAELVAQAAANAAIERMEEWKHRAEVAERALLTACVNLIKGNEDNVNMELLARVVYTNYLRKAEKELEVV